MSASSDSVKGIENRFRHLSVDVREERVVRYIIHQVQQGRHINDIINDPYVVAHFDETARTRISESPEVIEAIEQQIRREFAGYGGSVGGGGTRTSGGDQESAGRTSDAKLPDL